MLECKEAREVFVSLILCGIMQKGEVSGQKSTNLVFYFRYPLTISDL